MSADNHLCVTCDHCLRHAAREYSIPDLNGPGDITIIEDTIVRNCGAGNTNDPDARCSNDKFKTRNTVIVFKTAQSAQSPAS